MTIPARLQRTDLRFCLILRGKKAPFEQAWQESANYVYNDPRLLSHIASGGNYGVVCGFGNLTVIDCDSSEVVTAVETELPETFVVRTGRGNKHFYYFVAGMTEPIRMRDKEGKAVVGHLGDVQFTGKQCVAPPSIGPNGNRYEIEKDAPIATIKISQLRAALHDFIKDDTEAAKIEEMAEMSEGGLDFGTLNIADVIDTSGLKKKGSAYQGAHPFHGSTTGNNFKIDMAKNLWKCWRCDSGGGILSLIAVVNGILDCQDALPGGLRGEKFKEVVEIAQQKYGLNVEKRAENAEKSQRAVLLKLVMDRLTLFHDGDEAYAAININGHQEVWLIKSKRFRQYLSREYYNAQGSSLNSNVIKDVITTLEGKAIFGGIEHKLHNRVAWHEGALWYDLSNDKWQGVKINAEGWQIETLPTLFRRYKHQIAQVIPSQEGDIDLIFNFVNISEPNKRLLFKVYIVHLFIPDIPHVVCGFDGPQGVSKTTATAIATGMVDPSYLPVLSFPKDKNEAVQQLSHHWFCGFDNISYLPDWLSDLFCRATSGEGYSKRELYSDDEDIIYSYRRCICLNGINKVAGKPDLLDRSMLFSLAPILPGARKSEQELWNSFMEVNSSILGAIFNVLVKAIQIKPTIKLSTLPRMADFCIWGCAISEAMGYTKEDFLNAYNAAIGNLSREALSNDDVGEALLLFMEDKIEWTGRSSGLLTELEELAERLKIRIQLPKNGQTLSRRLTVLKASLQAEGIVFEVNKGGKCNTIHIQKVGKSSSNSSTAPKIDEDYFGGSQSFIDVAPSVAPPSVSSESGDMEQVEQFLPLSGCNPQPMNISKYIIQRHHEDPKRPILWLVKDTMLRFQLPQNQEDALAKLAGRLFQ